MASNKGIQQEIGLHAHKLIETRWVPGRQMSSSKTGVAIEWHEVVHVESGRRATEHMLID